MEDNKIFIEDVLKELRKAYSILNEKLFDNKLDKKQIFIEPRQTKKNTLAYYCINSSITYINKNEFISFLPISFTGDYISILSTLVHEMCHQYNHLQNNKRGHSNDFKKIAEKVFLDCEKIPKKGWAITNPKVELVNIFNSIEIKKEVFENFKINVELKEAKKRSKYIYNCTNCYIEFTNTKKLPLVCGQCNEAFQTLFVDGD